MSATKPSDIRNIALVGARFYAGKTTLIERAPVHRQPELRLGPPPQKMGTVEEGTTVSDFSDAERHHKHSLTAKLFHFSFHGRLINLIDTPAWPTLSGTPSPRCPRWKRSPSSLDALRGIESSTRRLMNIAADRRIPRIVVINKVDIHDADLELLVERIRDQFGSICLPINLPAEGGKKIINVFDHDGSDSQGDATDFSSVREAHKAIIEQIVEVERSSWRRTWRRERPSIPRTCTRRLRSASARVTWSPSVSFPAKSGVGADDLLHILADLCPAPTGVRPSEFQYRPIAPRESPPKRKSSSIRAGPKRQDHRPRFQSDRGPVRRKARLLPRSLGGGAAQGGPVPERPQETAANRAPLQASRQGHIEVHEVGPGDIGAVAKIEELHFNGVLHDSHEHDSVHLTPWRSPSPCSGRLSRPRGPL